MKKRLIIHIAVGILVASCQKPDLDEVVNLNGNKVIVMGHAGMGITGVYTMNTLESMSKCIELGASGTELDVQMTKDKVLVAFKPQQLEDDVNGEGMVNEKNFDEIKDLYYNELPFQRYGLVSVDEVFEYFNYDTDLIFTFDCKLHARENHPGFSGEFRQAILDLLDKHDMRDRVLIESQSGSFLQALKAADPALHLYYYAPFQQGLDFIIANGLEGITISINNISKEDVALAHDNGKKVVTWNTHTRKRNREAVEKHPDYIQTDMVDYLLRITDNKK